MTTTDRRHILAGLATIPVLGQTAFAAEETDSDEKNLGYLDDFAIGAEDAPVTVIEYLSYSCGACGSFHVNVWPEIKKNYIDTGKVRFVLRAFYRNQADLFAGMTARCGGERGYYPITDVFLSTQSTWTRANDRLEAIRKVGRKVGLSNGQLDACFAELPACLADENTDGATCLKDNGFAWSLFEKFQKHAEAHEVNATPTFIVGGEDGDKHTGVLAYDDFAELLDEKLS